MTIHASCPPLELDGVRIVAMLEALGQIGRYGDTGVWRTTYSPEWVAAMASIEAWATEAGLATRRDAVGNLWGRLEGQEGGPAVVSGSHIDSQCPGGRYDGPLGVVGALAAISHLYQQFGQPKRPVEMVALCEEEGSRFPTASFWGSRAIIGGIPNGEPDRVVGLDGVSIADAMRQVGLDPDRAGEARRDDLSAFLELHIEQGPILEEADLPVALVSAITGIRHTEVALVGEANHAGAFPMDARRDPMAGFAEIASGLINHAHRLGRPAVTTIGRVACVPNGGAIIPQTVTFTVDARHPDAAKRAAMYDVHTALTDEVANRRGLHLERQVLFDHSPCLADPELLEVLRRAAQGQGVPTLTMPSGAAHDTQQMARICPAAMIFVRSKDGRSHTPEEFSSREDIVAGIRVLAAAIYELAWT